MLFSSLIFLYLFLPFTLLGYYFIPNQFRNYWLLTASLIFFAWGGVSFTFILIASIVLNYYFGLKIQQHLESVKGYRWLFVGVSSNLLILGVFKYANFIIQNINELICFFPFLKYPNPTLCCLWAFHFIRFILYHI